MAPRTTFANLTDGLQPLNLFDQALADVTNLGVVQCTVTGTNALVLTPISAAQPPSITYATFYGLYEFVAPATSTGSVTAQVVGLAVLNVYKAGGLQAGSGDLVINSPYFLLYNSTLNSGAGGFFLQDFTGVVKNIALPTNQILVGNASNLAAPVPMSGDATIASTGAITVAKTGGVAFGTMATQNSNAVAVTGGSITGLPSPSGANDAATKQYVDASVAAGLTPHTQAVLATAAALPTNVYNNGTAGVGATLTASSNGALTVDGVAVSTSNRVVVKNEVTAANNGIYTVTATGSGGTTYILTRASDGNVAGTNDPNKIGFGSFFFVSSGSTNANSGWSVNSTITTIGTSAINFTQFSASGSVGANPTATIGLTTVNGAATTYMRSDAASSLSQAITPVWTGVHTFNNNVLFGSGLPWADVRFFGALGNNSNDDTTAIQNAINFMFTNFVGGVVFFPPGNYKVTSALTLKGGVRLVGSGMNSSSITASGDILVIFCVSACSYAGIEHMTVAGYLNPAATHSTIAIDNGALVNIFNVNAFGGLVALNTSGADGLVMNCFMQGYSYCVVSGGANWYVRNKFDTGALAGTPTLTAGFVQNASYNGSVAENHLVHCDFSASPANKFTNSVNIADAGTNTAVTVFESCVFSSPITISNNNARWTCFSACEIGSTSFNVGNNATSVVGCFAFSATTVTGTNKSLAGNISIS